MRSPLLLPAVAAVALLALPASAAIKALNLQEMMSMTEDCLDAQIVDKQTFRVAVAGEEGSVFTKVHVVGESMRTGEPVDMWLSFRGSHDPADGYLTSEMPPLQDVRLGQRVVLFYGRSVNYPGGEFEIWNLGCTYRVETVFGEPVVMGKGEGFPFRENVSLVQAREQVRTVHLALEADKATQKLDK